VHLVSCTIRINYAETLITKTPEGLRSVESVSKLFKIRNIRLLAYK